MNKPLLGLLLGGSLGILGGLSALFSAPELEDVILVVVIGSTMKGLIAGIAIGFFARRYRSLPLGIAFGLGIGAALEALDALLQQAYHLEIILPGSIMGLIVGYATQRYGHAPAPRVAD